MTKMKESINDTTKNKHITKKDIRVNVKVLMISDSLSVSSERQRKKLDKSGKLAQEIIEKTNFTYVGQEYLPDELDQIQDLISQLSDNSKEHNLDLIITIGGTGVAMRDITIEAIEPILDKYLPGFGELFRTLTYKEIGTVSMVTRALAGIKNKTTIVCLPGSPNAVKLGVELILKEIIHIINHIH